MSLTGDLRAWRRVELHVSNMSLQFRILCEPGTAVMRSEMWKCGPLNDAHLDGNTRVFLCSARVCRVKCWKCDNIGYPFGISTDFLWTGRIYKIFCEGCLVERHLAQSH